MKIEKVLFVKKNRSKTQYQLFLKLKDNPLEQFSYLKQFMFDTLQNDLKWKRSQEINSIINTEKSRTYDEKIAKELENDAILSYYVSSFTLLDILEEYTSNEKKIIKKRAILYTGSLISNILACHIALKKKPEKYQNVRTQEELLKFIQDTVLSNTWLMIHKNLINTIGYHNTLLNNELLNFSRYDAEQLSEQIKYFKLSFNKSEYLGFNLIPFIFVGENAIFTKRNFIRVLANGFFSLGILHNGSVVGHGGQFQLAGLYGHDMGHWYICTGSDDFKSEKHEIIIKTLAQQIDSFLNVKEQEFKENKIKNIEYKKLKYAGFFLLHEAYLYYCFNLCLGEKTGTVPKASKKQLSDLQFMSDRFYCFLSQALKEFNLEKENRPIKDNVAFSHIEFYDQAIELQKLFPEEKLIFPTGRNGLYEPYNYDRAISLNTDLCMDFLDKFKKYLDNNTAPEKEPLSNHGSSSEINHAFTFSMNNY